MRYILFLMFFIWYQTNIIHSIQYYIYLKNWNLLSQMQMLKNWSNIVFCSQNRSNCKSRAHNIPLMLFLLHNNNGTVLSKKTSIDATRFLSKDKTHNHFYRYQQPLLMYPKLLKINRLIYLNNIYLKQHFI